MVTVHADPAASLFDLSQHLAHERHLQGFVGALSQPGWQKRLTPLAQHMARQHLVRARGYTREPLRHLDLEVLCQALGRLLCHEWEDGYLIYQLVVDNLDPVTVAAERGVSRLMLTERLRDAVAKLATQYEDVANASLGQSNEERVRSAPARRRGYPFASDCDCGQPLAAADAGAALSVGATVRRRRQCL